MTSNRMYSDIYSRTIRLLAKLGLLCIQAIGMLVMTSQLAHAECPPPHVEPTREQIRVAQQATRNRGFMWEITKFGRTSYLYGTIHAAKLNWSFPGPEVVKALRASGTVALELNLLNEETFRSLAKGFSAVDRTPLPEPFVNWVKAKAHEYCLPYDQLTRIRPENQVAMITLAMARMHGLETEYGIDAMLAIAAKKMWKSVEGLETPQDQIDAFRSSRQDLETALSNGEFSERAFEAGQSALLRLTEAWSISDFKTLSTYTQWCKCLNTTADRMVLKRMLDDRNPKMASHIDELHAAGRIVFAGVGSLHMIGEKGLPALMAARGYTVHRVF